MDRRTLTKPPRHLWSGSLIERFSEGIPNPKAHVPAGSYPGCWCNQVPFKVKFSAGATARVADLTPRSAVAERVIIVRYPGTL
jgi:hypothetical protein